MQPPLFAPLQDQSSQLHHLSEFKRRSEHTPLSAGAHQNGHVPHYLNGNMAKEVNRTQQSTTTHSNNRCVCCPYGFHIDLGFVKFAEDVATGKEQMQNWTTPSKRAKRLFTSPFEPIASDSNNVTSSGYGPLDSSIDERSAMNNSMFDSSILSKSMDEAHSDLEDILVQHPDMLSSKYNSAAPSTPISILKHRSDSNVPQVIGQNGESPSQNHQSRLKLHQQRSFIASPPTSRRYNNALPTIMSNATSADTSYNRLPLSHLQNLPPMPMPLRTSTPSRNVNDEIQQILSTTQKQFNPNNIYASINSGRSIASAPTSPVPKTFYTATAQSISQLKKPPVPKSPSAIHAALNSSNSLGKGRKTPLQSTGSGTAGPFTYNYTLSSSPFGIESNRVTHLQTNPRSTQPPRRYLEGASRHRVISPEPEAQAYQRFTPTVLRNSNLQSRSYYHTLGGMSSSSSNQMPYRYKGGKTTSSLLDMDSFASVRRRKVDDVASGSNFASSWADSPTSTVTTGSNKWRSVSPQRSSSAPKWKHQDFQEAPISNGNLNSGRHEDSKDYFTSTTDNFATKDDQSANSAFATLLQMNGAEKEISRTNFTVSKSNREAEVESILYNSGTQTEALPSWKSISVGTDSSLLESLLNAYKKAATPPPSPPVLVSISTDTTDLEPSPLRSKLPPPPPPPKKPSRKDIIASVPNQRLEVEFQYCLGHEPEYRQGEEPVHLLASLAERDAAQKPSLVEAGCDSAQLLTDARDMSTSTTSLISHLIDVKYMSSKETSTESKQTCSLAIQTEHLQEPPKAAEVECQTDQDWLEKQVAQRFLDEKANKRKSVDKVTETDDEEASEFIMITCAKCDRSSASSAGELYEKIVDDEGAPENELNHLSTVDQATSLSNSPNQNNSPRDSELTAEDEGLELVDGLADQDLDTISIETDVQTVINVADQQGQSRQLDPSRAEAIRKLLTEPQRRQQSNFQRDSGNYRSYRIEKSKADDLDYITDRHFNKNDSTEPSTPSSDSKMALKEMVQLKKPLPQSIIPEPVPAKIPRPKFTKYSQISVEAENPDEEDEAADRLTPLRSEMRSLMAWGHSMPQRSYHHPLASSSTTYYGEPGILIEEDHLAFQDDLENQDGGSSSSEASTLFGEDFQLSAPLKEALETVNQALISGNEKENENGGTPQVSININATDWAFKYVQHEWLKLSTKKNANAELVEAFIDALEGFSPKLMDTVVNLTDQNGNTALHYAVSHENYDVVSVLLDSKVSKVDEMNKAGYSAVMLGALCEIKNETEAAIIQRLFQVGNVNAKAVKHAQTALMLAASHGRIETTNLLLNCGADVNIQDVDGSTALMCAAEHGQKEIVKILLKKSNIDASLTDCDNQTALSIAVENQHRDIGVLIYAHLNFSRLEQNENSVAV